MFTGAQQNKIEDAVMQVMKNLRRNSVNGSNEYSFDEGYKLFLYLDVNLYLDEMYSEFQRILLEKGVCSEKCVYAPASASSTQMGVVFWKKDFGIKEKNEKI